MSVSDGFLQLQASFFSKAGQVLDGVVVELSIKSSETSTDKILIQYLRIRLNFFLKFDFDFLIKLH